jgi:hypothetical protein
MLFPDVGLFDEIFPSESGFLLGIEPSDDFDSPLFLKHLYFVCQRSDLFFQLMILPNKHINDFISLHLCVFLLAWLVLATFYFNRSGTIDNVFVTRCFVAKGSATI